MKKSQKIFKKKTFFQKKKKKKRKKTGKNAILLVLPIEEISLRPELSSPPRFRIQGGYPKRDGGLGVVGVVAGRHFHFII